MSDETKNERPREIVIDESDVDNAIQFFDFFKETAPPSLLAALQEFKANKTLVNQEKVTLGMRDYIVTSPIFDDPIFDELKKDVNALSDDIALDHQLNEVFTDKPK